MLILGLVLPTADPNLVRVANRLAPPSLTFPFGTDLLGRDTFAIFLSGSRYTILTALMTTLSAGVVGYVAAKLANVSPVVTGQTMIILARVCFVVPSFLLRPNWSSQLIMAGLCTIGLFPLFFLTILIISVTGMTSWSVPLVLGPLWGLASPMGFTAIFLHVMLSLFWPRSLHGPFSSMEHWTFSGWARCCRNTVGEVCFCWGRVQTGHTLQWHSAS